MLRLRESDEPDDADRLATAAERLLEAERGIKGTASIGPLLADAELLRIARAVRG